MEKENNLINKYCLIGLAALIVVIISINIIVLFI
jgi:hypothetical protein